MKINYFDETIARNLAVKVIEQACDDFEYCLKSGRKLDDGVHIIKKLGITAADVVKFFDNNCAPYDKAISFSGKVLMNQMLENYEKYNKVKIPTKV